MHPNTLPCTIIPTETCFEQKSFDNHCTGKEYPSNDETRHTQIQTHYLKKSLIIAERCLVYVITLHMSKTHTVADRAISMTA